MIRRYYRRGITNRLSRLRRYVPKMKLFRVFNHSCKKRLVLKGAKSMLWQFGAGRYDDKFRVMDVLASSNGD